MITMRISWRATGEEPASSGFINAMPFNKSTYVYFYNKTMFDELGLEAPETWDDLLNIGKDLPGREGMVSLGFDDMAGMLEATLRQNGSDYVNEEGAQFNTEAGQQALDFIMEMYNNDYAVWWVRTTTSPDPSATS